MEYVVAFGVTFVMFLASVIVASLILGRVGLKARLVKVPKDSHLAVILPDEVTVEEAHNIAEIAKEIWPDVRTAVFIGDVELTVVEADHE